MSATTIGGSTIWWTLTR